MKKVQYLITKIAYKTTWPFWYFLWKYFLHLKIRYEDDSVKDIKNGPVLIISNHTSEVDPFIVGLAFRGLYPIHYLAKENLFKVPIIGQILWIYGSLKAKRGIGLEKALEEPLEILNKGGTVGIFPEGRVRRGGRPRRPRRGAAYLAINSGARVIPVYIKNGFGMTPKNILSRKRQIILSIGKPFYVNNPHERTSKDIDEVTNIFREKIQELKIK